MINLLLDGVTGDIAVILLKFTGFLLRFPRPFGESSPISPDVNENLSMLKIAIN